MAQRRKRRDSGQCLSGQKSTDCTFLQDYFGNRELRNYLSKKVMKDSTPTEVTTQHFHILILQFSLASTCIIRQVCCAVSYCGRPEGHQDSQDTSKLLVTAPSAGQPGLYTNGACPIFSTFAPN